MALRQIHIVNPADVATVAELMPVLREKTGTKAAMKLIRTGRKAIAAALAEPDADRRQQLLTQLGFN